MQIKHKQNNVVLTLLLIGTFYFLYVLISLFVLGPNGMYLAYYFFLIGGSILCIILLPIIFYKKLKGFFKMEIEGMYLLCINTEKLFPKENRYLLDKIPEIRIQGELPMNDVNLKLLMKLELLKPFEVYFIYDRQIIILSKSASRSEAESILVDINTFISGHNEKGNS